MQKILRRTRYTTKLFNRSFQTSLAQRAKKDVWKKRERSLEERGIRKREQTILENLKKKYLRKPNKQNVPKKIDD